eukprot:22229_1
MGSAIVCDGETREKLKQAEKKNQELKQQLIDFNKSKTQEIKQFQSEQKNYDKIKTSNQQLQREVIELSLKVETLQDQLNVATAPAKKPRRHTEYKPKKQQKEPPQVKHSLSIETTQLFGIQTAKQKRKLDQFADIQISDLTNAQTSAIQEDCMTLRNWIVRRSEKQSNLKVKLAKFLTERNETQRVRTFDDYNKRYHAHDEETLMDDLTQKMNKGFVFDLIENLFKTRVQFDATCIRDIVMNKKNKTGAIELADILCCRTINKLKEICYQYKQLYGVEMREDLTGVVSTYTYQSMIKHLFDFTRNDHKTADKNKIAAKLQGDVEYLVDANVKWDKTQKERLALSLVGNDESYVYDLSALYFKKASKNLVAFIDETFGETNVMDGLFGDKHVSVEWMKVRIEYCADRLDFYARKIQLAGTKEGHEINRIFLSMFGKDLDNIHKKFNELNYGDSKTMIEWIKETCPRQRHAAFLIKMLENCAEPSLP